MNASAAAPYECVEILVRYRYKSLFRDTHRPARCDESNLSTKKVRCEHSECDEEREATEQPRRDVPVITMSALWIAGIGGLLMLCIGLLLGSSWTVQALDRRCRRLARERREFNAWRRAVQEADLRCSWCGELIALAGTDSSSVGSEVSTPRQDGDPHPGTSRAVGARRWW